MDKEPNNAVPSAETKDAPPAYVLATVLQTTSGSVERAQRFIGLVTDEIPPLLSDLAMEGEGVDRSVIERAAHTPKTHASYVGAEALRKQAERVELLSRSDDVGALRTEAERLVVLGHATLSALKSIDWERLLREENNAHG